VIWNGRVNPNQLTRVQRCRDTCERVAGKRVEKYSGFNGPAIVSATLMTGGGKRGQAGEVLIGIMRNCIIIMRKTLTRVSTSAT